MSLIVYHNHLLGGDSRGIFDEGGWLERTVPMLKVWVNGENTMVFAMCGKNEPNINRAYWMTVAEPLIKAYEFNRDDGDMTLPELLQEEFGDEGDKTMMIGTHRNLYMLGKKDIFQTYRDETLAYGNGARVAQFAIRQGLDVPAAIALTKEVTASCGGSSIHYDLRKLTPFPVQRKPRGKKA